MCTPWLPTRSISACSTSTVARASSSARCVGVVAAPNSRASAESRTLGASSRVSTRRASRTVHSTGGRGQAMLAALRGGAQEADVEAGVVGDQHCAAGELEERRQHGVDLRRVVHHRRGDAGELRRSAAGCCGRGSTSVASSPSTAPPRTLTAPISVIGVALSPSPAGAPAGGLEVDDDERGLAQR